MLEIIERGNPAKLYSITKLQNLIRIKCSEKKNKKVIEIVDKEKKCKSLEEES